MTPGFDTEYAGSRVLFKRYEIRNEYDFPITLKMEVFTKNWHPTAGWKADKQTFKMQSNSTKGVMMFFRSFGTRKLIVCSTLKGIGYEETPPGVISRVCSRLVIHGVTGPVRGRQH